MGWDPKRMLQGRLYTGAYLRTNLLWWHILPLCLRPTNSLLARFAVEGICEGSRSLQSLLFCRFKLSKCIVAALFLFAYKTATGIHPGTLRSFTRSKFSRPLMSLCCPICFLHPLLSNSSTFRKYINNMTSTQ
jgi:hypothetical protein